MFVDTSGLFSQWLTVDILIFGASGDMFGVFFNRNVAFVSKGIQVFVRNTQIVSFLLPREKDV